MSLKKLEKIYERSLRFVANDFSSTYDELLIALDCDTLLLSRLKCLALHMFKCHKNLVPAYVNVFTLRNSNYELRDELRYDLYKFRTKKYGYNTVLYAGAKLWNSLPVNLKRCKTVNEFKDTMRCWKCKVVNCLLCQSHMYH